MFSKTNSKMIFLFFKSQAYKRPLDSCICFGIQSVALVTLNIVYEKKNLAPQRYTVEKERAFYAP